MPSYEVLLDNEDDSTIPEKYIIQDATDISDALTQAVDESSENVGYFDHVDIQEYTERTIT